LRGEPRIELKICYNTLINALTLFYHRLERKPADRGVAKDGHNSVAETHFGSRFQNVGVMQKQRKGDMPMGGALLMTI
jgi:hypothetical protein